MNGLSSSRHNNLERCKAMSIKQKTLARKLGDVIFSQLDAFRDNQLSDEIIESLLLSCGDRMLLACLDLIDSNEGADAQCSSTI